MTMKHEENGGAKGRRGRGAMDPNNLGKAPRPPLLALSIAPKPRYPSNILPWRPLCNEVFMCYYLRHVHCYDDVKTIQYEKLDTKNYWMHY